MSRLASLPFVFGLMVLSASAQPAAEPPSAAARLRDYEATYQQGLRKIQTPLLTDYVAKLQQLLTTSPAADQPAIQAEILRTQKLITDGGVIDLKAATSPQPEPPQAMPALRNPPGTVLTLKPASAKNSAVGAQPGTLSLGKAEWAIEHLDSGSYDVVALYSFPNFTGAASIVTSLGGKDSEQPIAADKGMPTQDQFRILRLGHFDFERDVNNATLKLSLKSTDLPAVQIRQVFLVKPRPRAP